MDNMSDTTVFEKLNAKMKRKMEGLEQELHRKDKSEKVKVVFKEKGELDSIDVLAIKNAAGLWIDLADIQQCFPVAMGLKKREEDPHSLPAVMVYTKAQGEKYSIWICDDDIGESSNLIPTYYVRTSCSNLGIKVGMCLSGGGYRASLFHVGALRRMNQLGLLRGIDTFSSVSGGSITNAILAAAWNNLQENNFSDAAFEYFVRQPVLRIATEFNMVSRVSFTQDIKRLWRFLSDTNGANDLADRYIEAEKYVYQHIEADLKDKYKEWGLKGEFKPLLNKTLKFLPHNVEPQGDSKGNNEPNYGEQPQFVFCGTDFRDGRAFYFSHDAVGKLKQDTSREEFMDIPKEAAQELLDKIKIAEAVAASSSYPMAFHPLMVKYKKMQGKDEKHFVAAVTDGGLFDNLGMDVVKLPCTRGATEVFEFQEDKYVTSKNKGPHRFIFVSDGGGIYNTNEEQGNKIPIFTALQDISLMGSQVNRLRTNWIRESYATRERSGALWQLNDIWELYHNEKFRHRIKILAKQCCFKHYKKELQALTESDKHTQDEILNSMREKLRSLTSIRTNLDVFTHAESKAVEVMGYYLTSIQLQNDEMTPIWKYRDPDGDIPPLPQCHAAYKNMDFDSLLKSVQKSDAGYIKNKFDWFLSRLKHENNVQGEIIIDESHATNH